MTNYKMLGDFWRFYGRLPKDNNELAKFILFGGIKNDIY